MGFWNRIARLWRGQRAEEPGKPAQSAAKEVPRNENVAQILAFQRRMNALLGERRYLARRESAAEAEKAADAFHALEILEKNGMLGPFCEANAVEEEKLRAAMELYAGLDACVEEHNERFVETALVEERDYLDHILEAVDPAIRLDEDQRKVVLTDEDSCLVIAGAGAGKTTTVAAKVKYLVDRENIDPSQILIISFTNKAVRELREKIQDALGLDCPIATFHSTGNAILHREKPEEKTRIVDQSQLYVVLRDYFRGSILKNEKTVRELILFFSTYFDTPYEEDDLQEFFYHTARDPFYTMRSELGSFSREVVDARTKKTTTIQEERLRSREEVQIANFLYLNQIDYEYEPLYPYYLPGSGKPYTPDFILRQDAKTAYLEHFGISEDGENRRYTEAELARYKKAVNDKVRLHKQHGTALLYTFSSYRDGRSLTEHLQEELEKAGFTLRRRPDEEVARLLVTGEENHYIRKMVSLVCRFISNFKVNGYETEDFDRMARSTSNVRDQLFLDICQDCYLEYERWLRENGAVDFEDMINDSARVLREMKEKGQKLDFKYVIVDEYQDISRQRFDLTKALADVTDAKVMAVGDDWQSIYAFSGSDISLFTKFEETMGFAKIMKIERTYRNAQEVIDIAGNFIQKNTEQIRKSLISPKHITDPVVIYTYDSTAKGKKGNRRSGENYAVAHAVEKVLGDLLKYKKEEGREPGSILLLGRFGFDGDRLERSGLFEYTRRSGRLKSIRYPSLALTFMTVHSSKGLGYDDVIILNGKNETYGFPAQIEDDPVLSFVTRSDRSIDYAEERRLFYVAMTRTKNRVFVVAPEQNPSEFLLELKREYKNVHLKGSWNGNPKTVPARHTCPICGYPLQLRYKRACGLRLYICTNEPEICGFMTNDLRGGKMSILKCDQCRDGYLIVKTSRKNSKVFLGCTNFRKDKTGCGRTISQKAYYERMGYPPDPTPSPVPLTPESDREKNAPAQNGPDREREDDAVPIARANLKPVLCHGLDLGDLLYTALCALQDVSRERYYDRFVLAEVLRGEESRKVQEGKLDQIAAFGSFAGCPEEIPEILIDWMLSEHLARQTRERHPVLHPTYEGLHYAQSMTERKLRALGRECEEANLAWT